MRFVDTNVLLYATSGDLGLADKTRIARDILDRPDVALSVQVLQEYYVQATRISRTDRLSHEDAAAFVAVFSRRPVQELTVAVVGRAIVTAQRFQISYWDAAILAAARALGCREVLSEDLSDGQDYDGVVVRNPFVT